MLKKSTNNIQLFLILEKSKAQIMHTTSLKNTQLVVSIHSSWLKTLTTILASEILTSKSTLLDICVNDLKKTKAVYYQYLIYSVNTSLTILTNTSKLTSLHNIFKNSIWLEREASEMFNIQVCNSSDHRRLLLDYSKFEAPLLKAFPCEGVDEYYYNVFEQQTISTKIDSIEL